jgi:hypothetical protein
MLTPHLKRLRTCFLKAVLPSRKLTFGVRHFAYTAFLTLKPASGKVFYAVPYLRNTLSEQEKKEKAKQKMLLRLLGNR